MKLIEINDVRVGQVLERDRCIFVIEVRAARDIGAWGLDYWCMKINEIVYKE